MSLVPGLAATDPNQAPVAWPGPADSNQRVEFAYQDALFTASGRPLADLLKDVLDRPVFSDADLADVAQVGIAITAAGPGGIPGGCWEYRCDAAGIDWTPIDLAAHPGQALLLGGGDSGGVFVAAQIRFTMNTATGPQASAVSPAPGYDPPPTLAFRIWDRSDNSTPGSYLSIPSFDPTLAYSAQAVTVGFGENHAPVAPASPISVSTPMALNGRAIINVADLMNLASDADGDPIGLAITALASTTLGTWEYQNLRGWSQLQASRLNNGQVLLLPSDASLRFTPFHLAAFTSGPVTISDLTFKAWDGSVPGDDPVETTLGSCGGVGHFSTATTSSFSLTAAFPASAVAISSPTTYAVVPGSLFQLVITTSSSSLNGVSILTSPDLPAEMRLVRLDAGRYELSGTITQPTTITLVAEDQFAASATQSLTISPGERQSSAMTPPPIAITGRDGAAVFTALGCATDAGVASILAALHGKDANQARAYAWDAATQSYVELPAEPAGGLKPWHGVFLVTRLDLPISLDGAAFTLPFSLPLHPGWNFLSVPPAANLSASNTPLTSHPWSDFHQEDANGNPIGTPLDQPWRWDGSVYQQVTMLDSGAGYWIYNPDANGTAPRRLVRDDPDGVVPMPRFRSVSSRAQASAHQQPPPPPGAVAANGESSAAASFGGGSCGLGGGIAGFGLLLFAALRLRPVRAGGRR